MTIDTTTRETLIAEVNAADLCSPESVCDAVLAAAEAGGIEAGRTELGKAIAADPIERKRLGLEAE